MTADAERLARIRTLTFRQALDALEYLAGYSPQGLDFALAAVTAPVAVLSLSTSGPEWFCHDCGAGESQVPLRQRDDGVYLCWSSEACDQRQAAAAGCPQPQGIPATVLTQVVEANARLLDGAS